MIREKIRNEMVIQGIKQSDIINFMVKEKGKSITPSQLSNFLSGKTSLHIHLLDLIFEFLGIELIRIL